MIYSYEKARLEIKELFKSQFNTDVIEIETPPKGIDADFAVPLYALIKDLKKSPTDIADLITASIKKDKSMFKSVDLKGIYLNFTLNNGEYINSVAREFGEMKNNYGGSDNDKAKTVIIDYSSPNIAKPFSIGHLRSTIIGQSLCNIYRKLGYKVIGDNHIGDWGTQFGKLITAYLKWGDKNALVKDPMKIALNLYVKYHEEVKRDKSLDIESRAWFKKLEDRDKEATEIWSLFKDLSLKEFEKIYKRLDVKFDEMLGESFYQDKTDEIISVCEKAGLAKWVYALDEKGIESKTEKVLLIDLKKYNIDTPLLLKKSDGTTLYATRDLAAIKYRIDTWRSEEILYVVGSEQKLYFRQLFKVAELLGYKTKLTHIDFGLISLPEGKMSTREGRVIFLEDVLNESIIKVKEIIKDRDMTSLEKDTIAEIIGIGAIKYADLSQSRIKDVLFDWKKILNLKGNSGPYLQYQLVRINSILEKSELKDVKIDTSLFMSNEEINLIKSISRYNHILRKTLHLNEPHILADYLFELSENFSMFYEKHSILNSENGELKKARLHLCSMSSVVIKDGLNLLGIKAPDKM